MHRAMESLSQLPLAERLELVQDLWDSIDQSRETMPPEQWQREIVACRLAEFDAAGKPGLTADEFWQRVDELRET